jgi:hypothetical protein
MVSTRTVAPLALLAVVPVSVYLLHNGELFIAAAFANLALIAASLWLLFGGRLGGLGSDSTAER